MFQKKRHKPLKQSCVILLLPEVWPQKSCKQIHTSDGALFRPPKTLPSPCLCYCNTKKPVHGQSMQTSKTALKQNEWKHLARALDFTHHTNLVIPCFEGGKSFTWGMWLSPKLWHKPKILQKGNCKLSEIWNFPFKFLMHKILQDAWIFLKFVPDMIRISTLIPSALTWLKLYLNCI